MDSIQEMRGYSDSREEEEFDEEVAAATAEEQEDEDNNITIPREETSCRLEEEDGEALKYNLMSERKQEQLDLLDLSLGRMNKNKNNDDATNSSSIPSNNNNNNDVVEKEHMFEKVVTPSDVGKLNRLVIPKQHAEKYFPLDSSSDEKGLLLNFEDMNNGKLWRFRYSYWNSSQSYVMTKGWSRFVKDKKLHSGDIVSFKRGVGDLYRHRLYIDWKRRSDNHHNHNHNLLHDPSQTTTIISSPFFLPNHYSIPWGSNGSRFYSFPSSNNAVTTPTMINYHHQQQQLLQYHQQHYDGCCSGIRSSTPFMSMHQIGDEQSLKEKGMNIVAPMIIDSVPVTYHHHGFQQDPQNGAIGSSSNSGKMLRLFGVNMECSSSSPNEDSTHLTKANSLSPSTRGRTTSLLFDLDPSLQYRN